ncbi:hypothetical protein A33Q_0886 [Indibacter alkaliphilus LW1]|uniref:Uncharacterized protein n=1 Tax=Indibacter alkaliphilus (strain CCUG 57479 / KCTC 22604 / LW1) TaxID=1189612 RepID=S2E9C1_INDAL|nr:DUF5677 domain-containing protein [Indibacter alkaliphilus]EOZ98903.1 hypothetical protein A33Q_0886 [Indibacter alkaliphilus LW1]
MKTKEDITKLALQVAETSNLILESLNKKIKPDFKDSYLLGILSRSAVINYDINQILSKNNHNLHTSVFILLRCLLDDFIHILHLLQNNFEEEEIVKIAASAHRQRFKTLEESRKINYKFFGGENNQLQTQSREDELKEEFLQNPNNDIFFQEKSEFKFKKFKTVQQLVDNLPETEIGQANVHAFILWKFLSQYIHFSNLTFYMENQEETRKIEIAQLEEVLFYCYKTIVCAFDELKKRHEFLEWKDPHNLNDYFNSLSV